MSVSEGQPALTPEQWKELEHYATGNVYDVVPPRTVRGVLAELDREREARERLEVLYVEGRAPLLAEIADAKAVCPACGHLWRQHDPEDGACDAHTAEPGEVGPCCCGRDVAFTRKRNAELSREALVGLPERQKVTHGRHCTCSACARFDWTQPQLACCGMHGPSCPPVYAPLGAPGALVGLPERQQDV